MVIYLDSSVALATVFRESRAPPATFWDHRLTSSRLLEYELRVRVNALGHGVSLGAEVTRTLGRIEWVELTQEVLARALEPFPLPLRTLDALHLASAEHLRRQHRDVVLATFDDRLADAARALGIPLHR